MTKELTINELFDQIIKKLSKKDIFLKIHDADLYLVENETFPQSQIKIGVLELQTNRYQHHWNEEWATYYQKQTNPQCQECSQWLYSGNCCYECSKKEKAHE